jgi:single-strand DNA-binding protein
VWDRQARVCADYLAKGRKIALEGRLKYRTWEEEGKKRSAVEVVAYRVEFLASASGAGAEVVPFEAAVA